MLDPSIIAAAYFDDPDLAHRRTICGRSADEFEHVHTALLVECAAPAFAVWLAWEGRSLDEALQRIREVH
jgi:hypothetical protein